MTVALPVVVVLAALTALLGTLGGIGGAVVLVPVLVLLGVDPRIAAPLGILSVASGSLAAGPRQLRSGLVHHRLGVVLEIAASAGAIVGALLSGALPAALLARLLAVVAIASAFAGGRRKGLRNPPHHLFAFEPAGEWPGSLGGAYHLTASAGAGGPGAEVTSDTGTGTDTDPDADDLADLLRDDDTDGSAAPRDDHGAPGPRQNGPDDESTTSDAEALRGIDPGHIVVPYQARNVPLGMACMLVAGLVSGLSGVGGGFIKTPTMSEIMKVPVKVAAATSTFTVGVTASASLIIFAGQGRIDAEGGAAVVVGGVVGGTAGAWLSSRLQPTLIRMVLTVALAVVGLILLVRG